MHIGNTELLLIFGVAVLLFGYKKLPDLGKGLGQAIKNFKRAVSEPEEIDISSAKTAPESAPRPAATAASPAEQVATEATAAPEIKAAEAALQVEAVAEKAQEKI